MEDDERDSEVYKPYRPGMTEVTDVDKQTPGEDDFASDEAEQYSDDEGMGEMPDWGFEDVETKSRFTNYSMTSSVIRRNDGLTLLDDRFEKVRWRKVILKLTAEVLCRKSEMKLSDVGPFLYK